MVQYCIRVTAHQNIMHAAMCYCAHICTSNKMLILFFQTIFFQWSHSHSIQLLMFQLNLIRWWNHKKTIDKISWYDKANNNASQSWDEKTHTHPKKRLSIDYINNNVILHFNDNLPLECLDRIYSFVSSSFQPIMKNRAVKYVSCGSIIFKIVIVVAVIVCATVL